MSDDGMKSMLSDMKDKNGQLPKELSTYNDMNIDGMSSEDLSSIRDSMNNIQEKMKARMEHHPQNNEQRLMQDAINKYKQGSTLLA